MQRNFVLTDVMKTGNHVELEQFFSMHTLPNQSFDCTGGFYTLHHYDLDSYDRRFAVIDVNYWNEKYDTITQLMANCPLRDHLLITEFLKYFDKNDFNFLLSSVQFRSMNPFWAFTKNGNGKFQYLFPDYLEKRSQDIEKSFCLTGSIWLAKHDSLLKMNTFHGPDCMYKEIDWISAIDIDDYEDLELANVAATNRLKEKFKS